MGGDRYDGNKLIAPPRKLLFCGSICRVTNLANEKSVIVVINGCGPLKEGRIFLKDNNAYDEFTSESFEFHATASAVAMTDCVQAKSGTEVATASVEPATDKQAKAS